jgi:hypothetical protein
MSPDEYLELKGIFKAFSRHASLVGGAALLTGIAIGALFALWMT